MQAANKEHLYKLLVIGDLGVGKTSIIKRYVHQNFSSHYRATIGVDFALKVLHWDPETVVRLQLWDIAGENWGRRSGGSGASQPVPSPRQKGCGRVRQPGLRGAVPKETFFWRVENLVSKKTKFLALPETCNAFCGARSCCFNYLPHPLRGSFCPARPLQDAEGDPAGAAFRSWPPAHFPAPAALLVTRP